MLNSSASSSVLIKDNELRYEYIDENNKKKRKSFSLTKINDYLLTYKEMNIIDDIKLIKKDLDSKPNANTLFVEFANGEKISLKELNKKDADIYNKVAKFLDYISDKDDLKMVFQMRNYVNKENIINSGKEKIKDIKDIRSRLLDGELKVQCDDIIININQIENNIDAINDLNKTRKLYDNYLPMLLEIGKNYINLQNHELRKEELEKAKEKMLTSTRMVNDAFETILADKKEVEKETEQVNIKAVIEKKE